MRSILIRGIIYTVIFKFILIKFRVRLGLRIRVFCWCILRDFFLLLYCPTATALEWIAHVNYNRPQLWVTPMHWWENSKWGASVKDGCADLRMSQWVKCGYGCGGTSVFYPSYAATPMEQFTADQACRCPSAAMHWYIELKNYTALLHYSLLVITRGKGKSNLPFFNSNFCLLYTSPSPRD